MHIEKNKELKNYNSFGVEAKARYFVELKQDDDFKALMKSNLMKQRFYILGAGNNTLFLNDYDGLIIKVSNRGIQLNKNTGTESLVEVRAGTDWNEWVHYCLEHGLYGAENLIDIPGNVGSAPIQNIGAYGAEVKDIIEKVSYFDLQDKKEKEILNSQCDFAYRHSIFKDKLKGRTLISKVFFKMPHRAALRLDYGSIKDELQKDGIKNPGPGDVARIVSRIRAAKLPDVKVSGNAGSFFKNPLVERQSFERLLKQYPLMPYYPVDEDRIKIPAAWLIEQTGWKGKSIKHVGVHPKQALIIINKTGKATGKDIAEFAYLIIEEVKRKFNIVLTPEVNFVG